MMSDLQTTKEEFVSGIEVEESGKSLRVASHTPHLISLGCDRLSTSVTIHPLRQGRVTLGSNTTSDIILQGTGVQTEHARIENSNNVVTLYPVSGVTTIDGIKVDTPVRLSQGCMIGIGRSNYLRFNHPAEANLMKSVLPNTRISMAPIQFLTDENFIANNVKTDPPNAHEKYQGLINSLSSVMPYKGQAALDSELDMINRENGWKKPPVAPRRMFRDLDQVSNSSSSDQEIKVETLPKTGSIMSKVSKFEYYLKNSQRGAKNTPSNDTFSPKVFPANSFTVNTPATDVIGKNAPSTYVNKGFHLQNQHNTQRTVMLNENNAVEVRNCSYTNVTIKTQTGKIDEITRNFDPNRNQSSPEKSNKPNFRIQTPSPSFNRNPVFNSPTSNSDKQFFSDNIQNYSQNYSHSIQGSHSNDNQRTLEQARIDEILNMCAEYEKQHAIGSPTTPTEKKTHNKIITNGSLPRGYQNNPNIVPASDGYYRIDAGHHKSVPTHQILSSPNSAKYPVISSQNPSIKAGCYETSSPNRVDYNNLIRQEQNHHNLEYRTNDRQNNFIPSNRQFPITELSSPVMIRKIARNAQNSSNYVGSYERNPKLNLNIKNNNNSKTAFSPYENISIQAQALILNGGSNNFTPKSPNSSSPRTKIKTTYAHKNATPPQYFIFPSPPSVDKNNHQPFENQFKNHINMMDDIPMIDDTNFANELEIRISKLNPENREKNKETVDNFIIEPLENVFGGQRRNFEEIKRDLIAGIPEFDAFHDDIDKNHTSIVEEEITSKMDRIETTTTVIIEKCIEKEIDHKNVENNTSPIETSVEMECDVVTQHIPDEKNDNDKIIESCVSSTVDVELNQLEKLYSKRKQIMNDMKDTKTDINDFELSTKQSELELDDFEIRIKTLQERILKYQEQRHKEIEVALVPECDKLNFKLAQDERHIEMKEMLKKLEHAEILVNQVEKDFSKGDVTLEELRTAQELLENERKLFEDMEFQHLEKESEFVSRMSKEQNVLQNDPWGTCKKIESLKEYIEDLKQEFSTSITLIKERNDSDNPHIKKLLVKLTSLENDLQTVNDEITKTKKDIGIYRINENNDLENRKARIKSGDFSPPTSDDDDMDEVKSRMKSFDSENHKTEEDNLDSILEEVENMKSTIDPMSMSMIIETHTDINNMCSTNFAKTKSLSPEKTEFSDTPNDKKGFWERNFDSLSRLKSKDKKSKSRNDDIMSQSLNENMFYNNENIESEYGTFDKYNNCKDSKCKENGNSKSQEFSKSKMSTLTSLGKIIRRDSLGKKNKDTTKRSLNDKENFDVNIESNDKNDEVTNDQKNVKHRYLKNSKVGHSENKYSKSKVMQNHNTSADVCNNSSDIGNGSINFNHTIPICENISKIAYRKSAGDEIKKKYLDCGLNFSDSTKVPSQDDIDRISKVALDSPIFSNNGDMNSLGRKTLDSFKELERNRVAMLEQKGCQVIENEREKMSELKKRIQNETTLKWEENQLKTAMNEINSVTNYESTPNRQRSSLLTLEEQFRNSLDCSSIIEDVPTPEKHLRNSGSDSYSSSPIVEDGRSGSRSDQQSSPLSNYMMTPVGKNSSLEVRPLSEMSDMSSDNGASPLVEGPRRSRKVSSNSMNNSYGVRREDSQRPLTRYLPIENDDLNLRQHIESAGHQVDMCPHVCIDSTSCRGYLHKLGAKFHGWSKRWFVFDRSTKTLIYYSDKNEKKPRGGAYFQVIEEVYMDHLNASKSPTPLATFVIKTRLRRYYLMAPSGPAARIWIDVVFTGAQGYKEYLQ